MVDRYSKKQKHLVFWGYIVGYILLQAIGIGVVIGFKGAFSSTPLTTNELMSSGIYVSLVSAVITFIAYLLFVKNVLVSDFLKLFTNKRYILIILGGVVLMYLSNILLTVLYDSLGIVGTSENQELLEELIITNPLAMLLPVALLIPVIEEILFRGVLLEFFEKRLGIIVGAILSSTLFAFLHVTDASSLIFLPVYFTLGLILTIIYIKSGKNIMVSIAAHVVNNTLAVIAMLMINGGL